MSTTTNDKSDIQQAADNVNVKELEQSLQDNEQNKVLMEEPAPLTEEQKTPFIDEKVRTDNSK